MRPTPTATDAEKSSTDLTQTAVDPTLRLENLLNSTGPWIPPANPDALAGDLAVPPTEEVVDVAHNMNTKRAKTQQGPNSSKTLNMSGATGDKLKKSNAGFLIADELARLYSEGKFSSEPNRRVDKTMLYDEHHPNFVGVPIMFQDPKRYRDAMKCVYMGMNTSFFDEYVKGNVDEHRVREIAHIVARDTLHKMQFLECTYNIRDSWRQVRLEC